MCTYSVEELENINAIISIIGEYISHEEALFTYYEIYGEEDSLY